MGGRWGRPGIRRIGFGYSVIVQVPKGFLGAALRPGGDVEFIDFLISAGFRPRADVESREVISSRRDVLFLDEKSRRNSGKLSVRIGEQLLQDPFRVRQVGESDLPVE